MAKEGKSADSVYKVTEVIGTSAKSWEDAARAYNSPLSTKAENLHAEEQVAANRQLVTARIPTRRI